MLKFQLSAYYDNHLSCLNFNIFKQENNVIIEDNKCIIFNNGSGNKPYFKKSHLVKLSKDQLVELAELYNGISYKKGLLKNELIKELLTVSNEEFFRKACDVNCLPYRDFIIYGYSQGDNVRVWQIGGEEFSKEYLTNLFYATPVYCTFKIFEIEQGVFLHDCKEKEYAEFYLDELLEDNYTYDKDQIINKFKLHNRESYKDLERKYNINLEQAIKDYLSKNLPNDLDYK